MNIAYLPMGSMQIGPNGELIPTSIPASRSETFHALTSVPVSTHGLSMMDPASAHNAVAGMPLNHLQQSLAIPQIALQNSPQQLTEQLHHQQPPPLHQSHSAEKKSTKVRHQREVVMATTMTSPSTTEASDESEMVPELIPISAPVGATPILVSTSTTRSRQKEPVTGYTIVKVEHPPPPLVLSPSASVQLQQPGSQVTHIPLSPTSSRAKAPQPNHVCAICAKDFQSDGNLKRHMNDFHAVATDRSGFRCELCDKEFQNRFNLRRHRIGVHGGAETLYRRNPPLKELSPTRCDLCFKDFNYGDNLKRHKKNVHNVSTVERLEEGETMSRGISKLEVMAARETLASMEPTIAASVTSTATETSPLTLSEATVKAKPFICNICHKNLKSNFNLKRHHIAVHKETRILYGCDECEKNFTSITNYRRHKVMIHGPGKEAYRCHACQKNLASKDGLRRHMESVHHTIEKNFVCDLCDHRFLRKEYLAKHKRTHEYNAYGLPRIAATVVSSPNLL